MSTKQCSVLIVDDEPEPAGDLTGLRGPNGKSIVGPTTGQLFPEQQDSDRINPVATASLQNYLKQLPNSSTEGANYLQQTSTPSNRDGYDLRRIWPRPRDSNPRYRCSPVQRFSKCVNCCGAQLCQRLTWSGSISGVRNPTISSAPKTKAFHANTRW